MEEWKSRLVKEALEVNERLIKLGKYIDKDGFYELDLDVQTLMKNQRNAMELYLYFLAKRIELYGIELPFTVDIKG